MQTEHKAKQKAGRWKLLAVVAVCAAPMIFSYLTYYVIKPEGRTNYGALIDPKAHPIPPALGTVALDGKAATLDQFKGKWIMLQPAPGQCDKPCVDQLIAMRQLRVMQNKGMERIERVWLVTDEQPLSTELMKWIDGTHMLRVKPEALKAWLPTEEGTQVTDHLYLIDPLGNLMMRFPKNADPKKVSKDLSKLLKASAIG
ncbi:cytochrome C oxidase subunit I [Massilia sp. PAMC28688]|uniref:SCO family protein n=1 Tax=Massilia sp. PAMC28688 TaxID=2861283 RepID=UPI001C628427|nr:cytochrome C oxidase subunit I [Massilia sp. PAMC28688]QYF94415.1 cytochrome C oxidase subunit I [Massilia sp. PAMC28688]